MFELFVFDLDGVLWDSNEAHVDVVRKALLKAGFDLGVESSEITEYFGLPYRDVLRAVMGEGYTPERLDVAYAEQQRLIYDDAFFKGVRRIDGIASLLSDIKKSGSKIAIASGNQKRFLSKALDFLGVSELLDLSLSVDDVRNSKPDPEIILKAMHELKAKPEGTVFVGDAKNDVLAAKSAGVSSAVVLTGALGPLEAEALDPDFILDSVLDLEFLL